MCLQLQMGGLEALNIIDRFFENFCYDRFLCLHIKELHRTGRLLADILEELVRLHMSAIKLILWFISYIPGPAVIGCHNVWRLLSLVALCIEEIDTEARIIES